MLFAELGIVVTPTELNEVLLKLCVKTASRSTKIQIPVKNRTAKGLWESKPVRFMTSRCTSEVQLRHSHSRTVTDIHDYCVNGRCQCTTSIPLAPSSLPQATFSLGF